MNTWIKRLGITVGVLVLTFGLAFVALSVTSQQIGMSGKQVYSYDSATGFARMEVVVDSMAGFLGVSATEDAPTLVEGADAGLSVDLSGSLRTNLTHTIAGEAVADDVLKVETRGYYTNITLAAPTTTVIKSGPGWLQNIIINKTAATGVITCYDNTSAAAPIIATITQPAAVLAAQVVLPYNTSFSVGLTCVTATAAQDITVVVR